MKVLFHYAAGARLRARLAALAAEGLEVLAVSPADETGYARALGDAEVFWHVLRPVTPAHLAAAPRLRLLQKVGVGVDTIDLQAARAAGVAVCNLPGTNTAAVAEHCVMLMLAVLRRVAEFDRETREGRGWAWPLDRQDELGELGGRTVGLLGMGATARRLAPILLAFGAEVLHASRSGTPGAPGTRVSFAELFARSDILSLHLPLTAETRGIVGAAEIGAMKQGAILINTARGGLVDAPALAAALRSGHLGGAGLDVFPEEPAPAGAELFAAPNLVATPHVAWLTQETFARSLDIMVENCRRLRAGEPLLHRVV